MKHVLSGYEPSSVFHWFEAICAIPHGSENEGALADFIENFAKERKLSYKRDGVNNLFITLPATEGYEQKPAVLLQGHLDMVCESADGVTHDFAVDGLDLFVENDRIGAKGTTLGGDDGIAVAYMLALLDGACDEHPTLECLFTVSEETGLLGATAFDPVAAGVTATYMINLDSEDESVITAGCAGGVRTDIRLPLAREPYQGTILRVALSGLSGGHSGTGIMEGHANALKVLSRILLTVFERSNHGFRLSSLCGGGKDNAIPRSAEAILVSSNADLERLLNEAADAVRHEPWVIPVDRSFDFTVSTLTESSIQATTEAVTENMLGLLMTVADGVQAMSADLPGFPVYSRNLGIASTDENELHLCLSSRSSSENLLDASELELTTLAKGWGGTASHHARYAGWDYAPVSRLRSVWADAYAAQTGTPVRVEVIHAGLECGILRHKMPDLDVISVGPDMHAIHTPDERLSIPSTARVFAVLCDVLKHL
jgi:dipeptidase D